MINRRACAKTHTIENATEDRLMEPILRTEGFKAITTQPNANKKLLSCLFFAIQLHIYAFTGRKANENRGHMH
jgi:hypothetical protein